MHVDYFFGQHFLAFCFSHNKYLLKVSSIMRGEKGEKKEIGDTAVSTLKPSARDTYS